MGNLDVPKVIQAAASSNLGVLSLLVLVLAFLAWRFFQRSDDRIKLAAFGLIFLGAIGFGASVFRASGNPEAVAKPAPGPASIATPEPQTSPVPAQAADAGRPSPAQEHQGGTIAGEWRGDGGYRFRFAQQGKRFRYDAMHDGKPVGSGDGTLEGRALRYRFQDTETDDQGSCEARLSENGRVIEGRCRSDGGGSWELRIER